MMKPATQIERVIIATVLLGSINSQEAEKRPIRARHLNSVISELSNNYGIYFDRVREKHYGFMGEPCYLVRYSILESAKPHAQALIDQFRSRRKATPINWVNVSHQDLNSLLLN